MGPVHLKVCHAERRYALESFHYSRKWPNPGTATPEGQLSPASAHNFRGLVSAMRLPQYAAEEAAARLPDHEIVIGRVRDVVADRQLGTPLLFLARQLRGADR